MRDIILKEISDIWMNPLVTSYVSLTATPDGLLIEYEEEEGEDFNEKSKGFKCGYFQAKEIIQEIEALSLVLSKTIFN